MWLIYALAGSVVCAAVIVAIRFLSFQSTKQFRREAYYDDRLKFSGWATSPSNVDFDFVGVHHYENVTRIPFECPLVIHINGASYRVPELTPALLRTLGGKERAPDDYIPYEKFLYIDVTDSAQEFGWNWKLSGVFRDDQIVGFSLARFRRDSAPCPILISFGDGEALALPIRQRELEERLGPPNSTDMSIVFP